MKNAVLHAAEKIKLVRYGTEKLGKEKIIISKLLSKRGAEDWSEVKGTDCTNTYGLSRKKSDPKGQD